MSDEQRVAVLVRRLSEKAESLEGWLPLIEEQLMHARPPHCQTGLKAMGSLNGVLAELREVERELASLASVGGSFWLSWDWEAVETPDQRCVPHTDEAPTEGAADGAAVMYKVRITRVKRYADSAKPLDSVEVRTVSEIAPLVLVDQWDDKCCEQWGWVETTVSEDRAREVLAEFCVTEDGESPARPTGPATRVWVRPDAHGEVWSPCAEAPDAVEFFKFDVTECERA